MNFLNFQLTIRRKCDPQKQVYYGRHFTERGETSQFGNLFRKNGLIWKKLLNLHQHTTDILSQIVGHMFRLI